MAKVQRILEVVRLTTCPGNLQPWRAVVVERDELDPAVREELLAADNWQGGHTQAPIWIYWYADAKAAYPEEFSRGAMQLVEVGALPKAYGWSAEHIKASVDKGEVAPHGMAVIEELIHGLPPAVSAAVAGAETTGACAVACLAAVNEGLGTALNMICRPSRQDRVKELLGVPEHCVPVWLQLVGYPAEDSKAGGQRPREPFSKLFFHGRYGNPFVRDEGVVAELREEGLIQPEATGSQARFEELKFLARMYGYPEV
jgi:nitroreductase